MNTSSQETVQQCRLRATPAKLHRPKDKAQGVHRTVKARPLASAANAADAALPRGLATVYSAP
jgi:hypothetical protein